ncbi:MAG: efflux RND transporter permease subunit [Pirellulales bacterium]|nr:efflux RND transporter permease subunit [Pirellulales bacterium]
MQLIEAFVANPVKVSVGVLLFALFGFIGLVRMPMQLTPEVQIPTITIETRWPSAAPQEVEREIVQEQEEQLKGVEGVTKMSAECRDSSGTITLEFGVGTDLNAAMLKVSSRLQQVPEYPEEADEPVISTSGTDDNPIAWFILRPRVASVEEVARFRRENPDLADPRRNPELAKRLESCERAHNSGLRTRRLSQLVEDHPELEGRLTALLPPQEYASAEAIAEFRREHPELAGDLEPAMAASDPQQAGQQLEQLARRSPELRSRLEEILPREIDVPKLRLFAEDHIEAAFERVPGVSNSNVFGGQETEMQVIIDPQKLAARQLTATDVRLALRRQNRDTTAGDIWDGKRRYVVRVLGQFNDPQDVSNVIIARRDGQPVYVCDVARVKLGYKKPVAVVKNFGTKGLAINCVRETGANVLDVMEGLHAVAVGLNSRVLSLRGLELVQVYDETEYIDSAIWLVIQNIVVGGLLTVGVLLLFLRSGRSTIVIFLAIPTSIIGTFLMLDMMGRSLNVISLAGLAFAVGMLVDNAVVVLENIFRHYQTGDDPFTAAVRGTKEVWGAVIASTLTTLAVFVPVLFVQEEAGQLFRDIALAISSAVALSLLVSVTVIPTAAARILRRDRPAPEVADFAGGQHRGGTGGGRRALGLVDRLGGLFVAHVVAVNRYIQHRRSLRLATVAGFVGAALLLSWLLMPAVEYLPTGNRNLVFGVLLPPAGYNVDQLLKLGRQLEDDTQPYWDIDKGDPANAALQHPPIDDYFFVAAGRSVFFGMRAVDPLRAADLVPLVEQVTDKLPTTFVRASQMSIFGRSVGGGGRSVDVEISGPELEELITLGGQIIGQVTAPNGPVPGGIAFPQPSLDLSSPEMHVRPKWDQSADMLLFKDELDYAVDALVDGAYAGDYYHQGDKIDLTIIGNEAFLRHTQDLSRLPIATPSGDLVSLAAVADDVLGGGPEQINRRERERAITIQVLPPPTMPLEQAINNINNQLIRPLREAGRIGGQYQIRMAGTADKLRATWNALYWNFILALLITYLLMAALFESWLYPFVIILSVPLGAVGGLAGLALLNVYLPLQKALGLSVGGYQTLDVLTMLGFVILIGTVVNNAILIVHQSLNHMREEGMDPDEAILASVRTRIRPIFMTTLTTVLGLSPLVLFPGAGSELYRGLGAVVLGGLIVSTAFTLVLVPTLFSLMMDTKAAVLRLFRQGPADSAGKPGPQSEETVAAS